MREAFACGDAGGCLKADAVLLGAVGGPKWDSQPLDRRPEAGLLALRQALGVYANVRPIQLRKPLRGLCPLRLGAETKIDFEIIRELVGDIYFGEHKTEGEGAKSAPRTWPATACRKSSASRGLRSREPEFGRGG